MLDHDSTDKAGRVSGDALGTVECTVGAIVAARGGVFTAQLTGEGAKKGATLTVHPEELAACKGTAVIALRGLKLANRCVHAARCALQPPR